MNGRIITIKGALDVLDFFTDCLTDAFRRIGFEVYVYDIRNSDSSNAGLIKFINKPVDFAIAYNNVGFFITNNKRCLWDILDIHYINIIVDAPVYYAEILKNHIFPKSFFLCVDREHTDFIERLRPDVPSAFLPHCAWNYAPVQIDKDRPTDIIYAGSITMNNIPNIPDVGMGEFSTIDLIDYTCHELITNPNQTTEHVIEQWLTSHNLNYDINRLTDIFFKFTPIPKFITTHFRKQQIEVLLNNGFKVNVYGENWANSELIDHANFIYHGRISPTHIFDKMAQSKIILNSMPWFKAGSHERIFNGMLAGGVVSSDYTSYIDEVFVNGEDMIIYDLKNMDILPDFAEKIIYDNNFFNYMASNGQKKVLANHMFINRAIEILEYFSIIKEIR